MRHLLAALTTLTLSTMPSWSENIPHGREVYGGVSRLEVALERLSDRDRIWIERGNGGEVTAIRAVKWISTTVETGDRCEAWIWADRNWIIQRYVLVGCGTR